jgi:hypothetical protein
MKQTPSYTHEDSLRKLHPTYAPNLAHEGSLRNHIKDIARRSTGTAARKYKKETRSGIPLTTTLAAGARVRMVAVTLSAWM